VKNFANALLKGWNSILEKRENLSEDLKLGQGGWQVWVKGVTLTDNPPRRTQWCAESHVPGPVGKKLE